MPSKLKHIGFTITYLLVILMLLGNFAISTDYKKVLHDLQNCPCEEDEFCRDGTCTASDTDNDGTITRYDIGNEAGIPSSAAVAEDNCSDLRNCVKNCTEIQNCTMLQNCLKICLKLLNSTESQNVTNSFVKVTARYANIEINY
jgi:hypothetical protein